MVLDVLRKKVEKLVDSLLDPLLRRVLRLSWSRRLLVLLATVALLTAIVKHSAIVDATRASLVRARVTFAAGNHIPLSTRHVATIRQAITKLTASLGPDLSRPGQTGTEPWPIAQVLVATRGLIVFDSSAILTFFASTSIPECSCWNEFPDAGDPPNIPASGWVLSALADLSSGADSTVRFLLREQNHEGWWSIFPVQDNQRYASVYGSSWAILGLNSQLERGLIRGADSAAVVAALRNGAAWLLNNRETNRARWRSYPHTANRPISESLSGLALHALHQVVPDALTVLDQQWLEELPAEIPNTETADAAALYDIQTRDGTHNDHFVQIRLPWLLIATVDAYPSANSRLRAATVRWLESAIDESGIRDAEIRQENWWRGELLIALRYLLDHSQ